MAGGSERADGLPTTVGAGFAGLAGPAAQAAMAGHGMKLVRFQRAGGWRRDADGAEPVIVRSGTVDARYRDGTVRLEKGHGTVMPRGLSHRGLSEGGAPVRLLRAEQAGL